MKQNVTKLFILILVSCNNECIKKVHKEKQVPDSQQSNPIEQNISIEGSQILIDSLELKRPDYFEIPKDAYEKYEKGKSANWFISDENKSKLYIVPYTDGSLTTAILTEDKIPDSNLLNLVISEGTKVNDKENAIKLAKIVSKKGITIGLDKEKVISILGERYIKQNNNSILEVLSWEYGMKEDKKDINGGLRPFIMNGLNHRSIAYFKKNKLSSIIFTYEVP